MVEQRVWRLKQREAREDGQGATTWGCWFPSSAAPRGEGRECPGTLVLTATSPEPHEETYTLAWHRGGEDVHLQRTIQFRNTGTDHPDGKPALFAFRWHMSAQILRAGEDLTSCQVQLRNRSFNSPTATPVMQCSFLPNTTHSNLNPQLRKLSSSGTGSWVPVGPTFPQRQRESGTPFTRQPVFL